MKLKELPEITGKTPGELYQQLTPENKVKIDRFVAQLIETQDNCPPLPDSQE